jgi:hypothetical protein
MMIFVPLKPVILVLGLMSGLLFVSFLGSSLLEGKAPFVSARQARVKTIEQNAAQATPGHKHSHNAPSAQAR